jgi:hypothetical protein
MVAVASIVIASLLSFALAVPVSDKTLETRSPQVKMDFVLSRSMRAVAHLHYLTI